MNITATMVKELRDKTGAGMMDAKKALVEVDGDMEKAMEVLPVSYTHLTLPTKLEV